MIKFVLSLGIFSLIIFFLGILNLLSSELILLSIVVYLVILVSSFRSIGSNEFNIPFIKRNKLSLSILSLLTIVNFIGALAPELAFDALWYHLTLPRLYLENEKIFYIPGGLLYYSAMPKLIEMLYIPALAIGGEVLAKLLHFSFGIGTLVVTYKLSRKFLSERSSLLVSIVFYSNLVVMWLSTTAYIDLGRAFFTIISLYCFINFYESKKNSYLILTAIFTGFAISSKLLAFQDLFIFSVLMCLYYFSIKRIVLFLTVALIVCLPWLIFSYMSTGNPLYPFFSSIYPVGPDVGLLNIVNFVRSPDPISPIYLLTIPIVLLSLNKFNSKMRIIATYSLLALVIWIFTPQTGGGRFIVPYLPAFSILAILAYEYARKPYKKIVYISIILIAVITIFYRAGAIVKYVPVVLGFETRESFLTKNLNFGFGDFYDVDGYFSRHIKENEIVLIYGVHNLYYIDFKFIHESWYKKGDHYDYILVQGDDPQGFPQIKPIYTNELTNVKLYKTHEYPN